MRELDPSERAYDCGAAMHDAEYVVLGKLRPELAEAFHTHRRGCDPCERTYQRLHAIYGGVEPDFAPEAIDEFDRIASAVRTRRQDRSTRWTAPAAVAACFALLTTGYSTLAPSSAEPTPYDFPEPHVVVAPEVQIPDAGGVDHPAQTYGRVLAGHARLLDTDGSHATTLATGTRMIVDEGESLQFGLLGKMLARATGLAELTWTAATSTHVDLELTRGMIAVRYDRKPSDPILRVLTPTSIVSVVGTVFTVEVTESGATSVAVLRGHVRVYDRASNELRAEIEPGYRYDVARSTFENLGHREVNAALPLSYSVVEDPISGRTRVEPGDGTVPKTWVVPQQAKPEHGPRPVAAAPKRARRSEDSSAHWHPQDDGEALLARLVADAESARRDELLGRLEHCRELHEEPAQRYRAGQCLGAFLERYGDDPLAVEGYLLVGMLRMDFALDYRAAEVAFDTFLERAPEHSQAELARFRLWLASTEEGHISRALERGRRYLKDYPDGKYVGRILRRFPELTRSL